MEASAEDLAAVLAAREGDREAFGVLVERYQEVAFRAAYLVVRDTGLAEDVAQEAFVQAYRNLGRFDVDRAPVPQPFRPWLLRIVTNLALNEVRARGRRRSLWERIARGPVRLEGGSEPTPERAVEVVERRTLLTSALRELSEDDQLVLYLRYFLDLPEAEIAVVIGKRPGTVKSRLHRASGRLRTVIEQRYPDLRPEAALRGGDS